MVHSSGNVTCTCGEEEDVILSSGGTELLQQQLPVLTLRTAIQSEVSEALVKLVRC